MGGCTNNEPYALRVLGDSMEPEFSHGEVIVIEPGLGREDGIYVVAQLKSEYVFRQLVLIDDTWHLKPLNEKYPTVQLSESDSVMGRIISKSSGKGRQIKTYL